MEMHSNEIQNMTSYLRSYTDLVFVETFLRKTLNKWSSQLLSVFGEKRKKISAHDQTLRGSEKDRRTCNGGEETEFVFSITINKANFK
ncbi:hypothetical protein HID58_077893 [Brassica napus]|uniref:Uncharacterized protein n=1 Tax=Brassica napus TaxID=3708 RepID=A0ABQ7YRU6_BRANA|nr:hypothetical protein HID58_077893 [Brassica napus]